MQQWLGIILLSGGLLSGLLAAGLLLFRSSHHPHEAQEDKQDLVATAQKSAEHVFDSEFREELKNRGRLHFEKIINENAMFLQQDLRLTSSQINEFMKQEITKSLEEAFSKYEESISDAKQIALDSIQKTQDAVEEQRKLMGEQLAKEITAEKARLLEHFQNNMTDIINHYVLQSIGDQINLEDQLEYILGELERNKAAIVADIKAGS